MNRLIDLESRSIKPSYGGIHPLELNEVLALAGLTYRVASNILGLNNKDQYLTLEEFIINSAIPRVSKLDIRLGIEREVLTLSVRNLRVERPDILYMNILAETTGECRISRRGPTRYEVSRISLLDLGEGVWWKR